MKAVFCNQRNSGPRKALCLGAPEGPAQYLTVARSILATGKENKSQETAKETAKVRVEWKVQLSI